MPFSVLEFSAKIKNKYPEYADMNDTLLVEKIIAKYPEYKTHVDLQATKDTKQKKSPQKKEIRSLFGLPKGVEKTIFPRAAAEKTSPIKKGIKGAFDIISAPGRAIAAAPALAPGGETFGQAFARTKAKPTAGPVGKFVSGALRDPGTALGIVSGGATVPAKLGIRQLGKLAVEGAVRAATPAIATQIEKTTETGKFKPSQIGEAVLETGLGALGEAGTIGVGKLAKKGLTAGGKKLLAGSAKIKDVTAKLAGKDVEKGVNNIINDVVKFKLESPAGGFKAIAKKARKQITKENSTANNLIANYAAVKPHKTIDVDEILIKLMDDIDTGKETGIFTTEQAAQDIVANIHGALKRRNMIGSQPITKLREIKKTISKGLGLYKKGKYGVLQDPVKQQTGEITHLKLAEALNNEIPGLKQANDNMRRLITVKNAFKEAEKRSANHDFISLKEGILLGSGTAAAGPFGAGMAAALAAALRLSRKGRGGSLAIKTGRLSLPKGIPTAARILAPQTTKKDKLGDYYQQ